MTVSHSGSTRYRERVESISKDILRNVRINRGFVLWMGFLTTALAACLFAYTIQLKEGLGVTGLRDITSWGMYISNFVFFVATSLIGMLISSILGLIGFKWVKPIARIAEIIAVAFAAIAGLIIISDMGRPDRLPFVFLYGRVQSPILWDVTVVTTYFLVSLMLWFIPMVPDLAIAKTRLKDRPAFLVKAYELLSINWVGHEKQVKTLNQAVRILLILIVPLAFAIHTVTSWLFAVTPRAGWDSSIFGPYFISGAFVSGTSAVIIAMYFYRRSYKLEKYLTDAHFEKIARVLALVSIIYIYFNINEFLVPGYKLKTPDAIHLKELLAGHFAPLFWGVQLLGLVIPVFLLLFKQFRKPVPTLIIACFVLAASWLKRYIIVVPPQAHPFLPVQNFPVQWMVYKPTLIEIAISIAPIVLALMIITVLSKFFPVLPIHELAEEETLAVDGKEFDLTLSAETGVIIEEKKVYNT
jgi:Ni/Fe-hydrogenase subunit HybB-like protein